MPKDLIYKVVPDITGQEIMEHCQFVEPYDFGDRMSYKDFVDNVESRCIMDYDGSGHLMIDDKMVKNSDTWLRDRAIWIEGCAKIPFTKLYEIFGDRVSFMWFNK